MGVVCSSPAQLQNLYQMGSGLHQRSVLCNLIPLPELPDRCQGSDLGRIFLSQGTSRHPDEEIQLTELFQTGHRDLPKHSLGTFVALCVDGVAVPGSRDLLLEIRLFGKDSHATH